MATRTGVRSRVLVLTWAGAVIVAIVSVGGLHFGRCGAVAGEAVTGEKVAGGVRSPPFKPGYRTVEPPVGVLGYRIGSYLTIEGVRAEKGKGWFGTLQVDTISGYKLDKPIGIWIKNVGKLPPGERCVLKGYETGAWIGTPEEVLRATGGPAPQAGWGFRFFFLATSVEQPENLKIGPTAEESRD